MPKSGYINGLDFKSGKDLGKYLNYLDSNKTAFIIRILSGKNMLIFLIIQFHMHLCVKCVYKHI